MRNSISTSIQVSLSLYVVIISCRLFAVELENFILCCWLEIWKREFESAMKMFQIPLGGLIDGDQKAIENSVHTYFSIIQFKHIFISEMIFVKIIFLFLRSFEYIHSFSNNNSSSKINRIHSNSYFIHVFFVLCFHFPSTYPHNRTVRNKISIFVMIALYSSVPTISTFFLFLGTLCIDFLLSSKVIQ